MDFPRHATLLDLSVLQITLPAWTTLWWLFKQVRVPHRRDHFLRTRSVTITQAIHLLIQRLQWHVAPPWTSRLPDMFMFTLREMNECWRCVNWKCMKNRVSKALTVHGQWPSWFSWAVVPSHNSHKRMSWDGVCLPLSYPLQHHGQAII